MNRAVIYEIDSLNGGETNLYKTLKDYGYEITEDLNIHYNGQFVGRITSGGTFSEKKSNQGSEPPEIHIVNDSRLEEIILK